jgi:reactive intermediate/imine deaminase
LTKQELRTSALAAPNGHFSQAIAVKASGTLVFISGMTARTSDGTVAGIGDITVQTEQVCRNLEAAVQSAGGTLENIVRVDAYVRNMEDFAAIHAVRSQFFRAPAPASTMVEVSKFVNKDYLIEINAIAVLPDPA